MIERDANTRLEIPLATHSFRQKYLYAFATQGEVLNHVRTQALREESEGLPQILGAWEEQQAVVIRLAVQEAGIAETIRVEQIPAAYNTQLKAFADDDLFRKTFSHLPTTFALVEADKLVAAQRTVNLDYVD